MKIMISLLNNEEARKLIEALCNNRTDFNIVFGEHYTSVFEFKIKSIVVYNGIDLHNSELRIDIAKNDYSTEQVKINIEKVLTYCIC